MLHHGSTQQNEMTHLITPKMAGIKLKCHIIHLMRASILHSPTHISSSIESHERKTVGYNSGFSVRKFILPEFKILTFAILRCFAQTSHMFTCLATNLVSQEQVIESISGGLIRHWCRNPGDQQRNCRTGSWMREPTWDTQQAASVSHGLTRSWFVRPRNRIGIVHN